MRTILRLSLVPLFGLVYVQPGSAQEVAPTDVRVFLDCNQRGCDDDYFRERITYVNWMRDRQDSNVHLLVTSEQNGGGGTAYTLAFLGRAEFAGVEDTLTHDAAGVATQDERRAGLARGLDLRINGSYSWIRDQLYLPKRTLDDEEILLRLQQLQTNFRYFTSIGFTYRFGSIFNNVVNPRLRFRGRGGGGGFFF